MKIKKLFQVLVLGGTTLGLGLAACGGRRATQRRSAAAAAPDGGVDPDPPGGPLGW